MHRPTFMQRLYNFVSKRPKAIIVASLIITFLFTAVLSGTRVQTDIHAYIDQKYIGSLDYINEHFDERDLLSVTLEAQNDQNILSLPLLKEQDRFFSEVQKKWPVKVDGLTTVLNRHFAARTEYGPPVTLQDIDDPELITDFFIFLYHADPYEFERLARKALSDDAAVDALQELEVIRHMVGILPSDVKFDLPEVKSMRATISTKENISRDERREIFLKINELSENYSDILKVRLYSTELIEEDIDERMFNNSPYVIGFMILLIAFILFVTFRSVFFTVMPVLILCLAIYWAFGIIGLFGIHDFAFAHIIAIPLLLGQCIDNLIHFNERFREEYGENSKKEAIKIVFKTAGRAAGLTTFLNMVAFSADIFTTNLRPVQEYALLIVLGLGVALVVTYIVGASVLLISNVKVSKKSSKAAEEGSEFARKLFDFLHKNKIKVLAVSILLLAGMVFNITRIDTAFRSKSFMPESFKTYEAYEFEQNNFKLYLPHYVLIKGDIAAQAAIDAVTVIENALDEIEDVEHIHNRVNVESINYLLAKFDEESYPDSINELYNQVLESEILINPVLLLRAKDIAPKIIEKRDEKFTSTLVKFWPAETDSFAIKNIADSVKNAAQKYTSEFEIKPTGYFLAFSRTMDDILWSAVAATFITFSIILFILWLSYKRLKTSLLAVIPILFGSSFGLGMLPFLNIELNALNGTIAVLAMGLGIDYAIQIMNRYHEELGRSGNPKTAMRECFGHMIMPLGQCVILTTAGLFVLVGLLPITGKFGIAAAVSLITGYLGAILIMPIFAVKFVKQVPESVKNKFSE